MHIRSRLFSMLGALLLSVGLTAWASFAIDASTVGQHLDTATPTEYVSPTPTVTSTKPAVRTEITFPTETDILFLYARIEGTGVVDNYREYQIHIAPAGTEAWSWLTTGYSVVRDNAFLIFDTRQLPDGLYDLRLRVMNTYSNYTEDIVRGFEIRNLNPPTATATPEITRTLAPGQLPLPSLSPLETPTPTSTPYFPNFVPGGQGLYKPGNEETIKGVEPIVGTVNGRGGARQFQRYELYISGAGAEDWQWLYASQQQFFNDIIYRLDTSRYANGLYDLRLRIVYRDSNYDEYHTRDLRVDNDPGVIGGGPTLELKQPRSGSLVVGQTDIRGTVIDPQFSRWELYWSAANSAIADDRRDWLLLYVGDYQIADDLIARIDLSQVTRGWYDVRVRLVRWDGNYEDAFIRRLLVALPTAAPPPSPHR